ncbi:MAG: hypothetical protein GEV05_09940 [Betaproteobacteria bacterium]|nr:hypothetical protein [Betaproteobacteria bacterium]
MKAKKTALTCACTLAALSGQALAVAPGNCDPAVGGPFAIDIYLSGASAPQNILGQIMTEILNPGFTTVYDTATGGSDYRAYCGTLNGTTGALNGKKVRFLNRARGGSVWGVNPVARDRPIANMIFAAASCVAAGGPGRQFDCAEVGDDLNAANPNNRQPDFGVSDVEPAMFKEPLNVEFGQDALSAAEIAKFAGTQRATNQVIFGIGLSQSLVNAGLTNISRAQVAAVLTGNYGDWNQVNPAIPAGTNVTVCRRVQGSGTQATFNSYFNDFPCSVGNVAQDGNTAPLRMSDSFGFNAPGSGDGGTPATAILIDPTQGPTYVENPSSGNVRTCVNNANAGIDWAFRGDDLKFYRVQFSLPAATLGGKHAALANLSLDSYNSTNYGTNWSFINLDGLSPVSNIAGGDYTGLRNVITGAYDFVVEQSIQWKNDKVFPSGDYLAFINLFVTKSRQEPILRAIPNVSVRAAVVALPGVAGNTPTIPANPAANQTSQWTRSGNSCRPASLLF